MSQEAGNKFNQTDVYRVRRNTRLNQGLFLCKLIMKKHGTVQIQGMGECVSLVTKFSQILSKNGSENVTTQGSRSINPKLMVKLKKSPGFDKLTQEIILKS